MALNKNLLPLALLLVLAGSAAAQNCGCSSDLCCSEYGYCGSTDAYCGEGCQSGPCTSGSPPSSSASVSDIITNDFFNGIINQADSNCPGQNFYTRSAFLSATDSYPNFGTTGFPEDQKTKWEIATFFAHVTQETRSFCYIEVIDGASYNYCDSTNTQWPCNSSVSYYGRGPLQISWNYNYGPAGQSIGFDDLNSPQTVANDAVISFETALWFWMKNVHSIFTSDDSVQGFGATIRAINNIECNGGNTFEMNNRVGLFVYYCQQLGVNPGPNLSC